MIIFGSNKKDLHKMRLRIDEYLNSLGLELKGNWQVFRFEYVKNGKHYGRDLDFLGFRFFRNKTILRKKLLYKATRKARRMCRKTITTVHDKRQLLSYLGWFGCTDTYNAFKRRIKPFVNIKSCKRSVSNFSKGERNVLASFRNKQQCKT